MNCVITKINFKPMSEFVLRHRNATHSTRFSKICCSSFVFLFLISLSLKAQHNNGFAVTNIFQTEYFIENHGQFNRFNDGKNEVKFAVDNKADHIYFNANGFVYQLSKMVKMSEREMEAMEKDSKESAENEEAGGHNKKIIESNVTMRWLNANPNPVIETVDKSNHYFTYGTAEFKSYGYKKIIYKNLYYGIDVEYIIPDKGGVKYSLILHPGADVAKMKFQYSGDDVKLKISKAELHIKNKIWDLVETNLNIFYEDGTKLNGKFVLTNNIVSFQFTQPIDTTKKIIIDPWVVQITTLTSAIMGKNKGFDVDFDYADNLYVYGGGYYFANSAASAQNSKIAKFNSAGTLLWTFQGSIPVILWDSKGYEGDMGNFVVQKPSGKVYIGQGFDPIQGTRIVRLDANGFYDSFVSKQSLNFRETWEMNIDCHNGNIFGMGGSTVSDQMIGVISPIDSSFFPINITGVIPIQYSQDIVNSAFDKNGNLYVIVATLNQPTTDNHIYKLNNTYSGKVWGVYAGYKSLNEANNKLYYNVGSSNGFNAIAANNTYLFYYDGRHVKAFKTFTGIAVANIDSVPSHTLKMQGGIYADDCSNIFVGGDNGNLKVFSFNGSSFTAKPDVVIPGMAGRHVYDIKYNTGRNLLYVSGDSFVAVIPPNIFCADTSLKVKITIDCPGTAIATLLAPDLTAEYTYIWTDSITGAILDTVILKPKYADTITGLQPYVVYILELIKNPRCGGINKRIPFTTNKIANDTVGICIGNTYTVGTHTYSIGGDYRDTIQSFAGCDSINVLHLIIYPNNNFTQTVSLCTGDTLFVGTHQYTLAGNYLDTLATYHSCDSFVTSHLSFISFTTFVQAISICNGNTVTIGTHSHSTSGVYIDTTQNYLGCDSIVTTNLTIKPTSGFSQNVAMCDGQSFSVGIHNYTTTGIYSDTFVNYVGCDSIITTTISFLPAGVNIIATPDSIIFIGSNLTLTAQLLNVGDSIVSWNPSSTLSSSTNAIVIATPTHDTWYYITTVSPNGCVARDSILIQVVVGEGFNIPNSFTPNGDGLNDDFAPVDMRGVKELKDFSVYNRWGERVFHTQNRNAAWNGIYKGEIQPISTFMWMVNYIDLNGKNILKKGDVTLIK